MSSPSQPEIPAPLGNLKIQYTKVRKTLAGGAFPAVLVKTWSIVASLQTQRQKACKSSRVIHGEF